MEFAVFDIETRVDKQLLNRVFYPNESIGDDEACSRFRDELRTRGSDFFPLTLHVPISIAIGEVGEDYVLRDIRTLGTPADSEELIVRKFWTWLEDFQGCLVSFNGRRFDLPVLELAALRWGVAAPRYFDSQSVRSPGSLEHHLDVCEFLTNFGEVGLRGGMDLLAKLTGLPGKLTMNGGMVQDYFEAGRFDEIHDYCRADVIQTYFLFLRVELMRGRLTPANYEAACLAAAPFLGEISGEARKWRTLE